MTRRIAVLGGDGIGPEVTESAVAVLRELFSRRAEQIELVDGSIGAAAIEMHGSPLPVATLSLCRSADAVLLGAVGSPKFGPDSPVRPEDGLLQLRRELGVFANLRPIRPHPALAAISPLKADRLAGVDVLFVRELTGGIYFGAHDLQEDRAEDVCTYTRLEIERVTRVAAGCALGRRGAITVVDKANVLATSRLWRRSVDALMKREFPTLSVEYMLVDSFALQLIHNPKQFDVVLTENLFGDILTDEAAALAGSLGMLPSASLGAGTCGLFEPVHGSAPDIAGRGIANPYGAILAAAMLLRCSFGWAEEADRIENAVHGAIARNVVTRDIAGGSHAATTRECTLAVIAELRDQLRSRS